MSVNSYLEGRASSAVLSGAEEEVITTSINTINARLRTFFRAQVSDQFRFGSSTRGTILPRRMDEHSDIDYMVVFADSGYTPQTYLNRLRRFADYYYASSVIKQSSPSIVLELNHIKFDLVPALKEEWVQLLPSYRIPDGPDAWQNTNPNDFNATLTRKNKAHFYLIKPTIRLAKFWNAQNSYVYESFSLERFITGLLFTGCFNYKDCLFHVIDNFADCPGGQWHQDRVARAKAIVARVRDYERNGSYLSAESETKKLIPD